MNNCLPFQVAFITGMSNPNSWYLSSPQKKFINTLNLTEEEINLLNFPYSTGSDSFKKINILRASFENTKMFYFSRSKNYKNKYSPKVRVLLDRAAHTMFISGSCGLELLSNLDLPKRYWNQISVFAYGPVSVRKPPCNTLLVQGEKDWISRLFLKQVDYIVPGGHMSYMTEELVIKICQKYLAEIKTSLGIG